MDARLVDERYNRGMDIASLLYRRYIYGSSQEQASEECILCSIESDELDAVEYCSQLLENLWFELKEVHHAKTGQRRQTSEGQSEQVKRLSLDATNEAKFDSEAGLGGEPDYATACYTCDRAALSEADDDADGNAH